MLSAKQRTKLKVWFGWICATLKTDGQKEDAVCIPNFWSLTSGDGILLRVKVRR